ncbi:hypothetical protein ACFXKF_32990 [Streptomyces scopuliridis]|uniref:hypothetical protein n=1 Tax=Streptomyces scopuliridis TaxID=452529 RepID=UPI00368743B5
MTTSTPRTSTTHRSRIARRLDRETGMGYQRALDTVREKADALLRPLHLERLDAGGCDLILRALLQQSLEFWGPGIGAHMWPTMYHPLFMGLPGPMSDAALEAVTRAGQTANTQAEPVGTFDPSWLAAAGVEALDYDAEPDYDEEDEDEIVLEELEPLEEPDRWKGHVVAQGRRDAFVMPSQQSLSPALREKLQSLAPAGARARLEQLVLDEPVTVEAYVLRAALAFPGGTVPAVDGPAPSADELADARRWYECAVTVGEQALHFFNGALLWHEESNRPFLEALYGLALVHCLGGSWNTSEQILFALLHLDPYDEQQAGALLAQVRRQVGLPAPREESAS